MSEAQNQETLFCTSSYPTVRCNTFLGFLSSQLPTAIERRRPQLNDRSRSIVHRPSHRRPIARIQRRSLPRRRSKNAHDLIGTSTLPHRRDASHAVACVPRGQGGCSAQCPSPSYHLEREHERDREEIHRRAGEAVRGALFRPTRPSAAGRSAAGPEEQGTRAQLEGPERQ
jgi:hypothetical protein